MRKYIVGAFVALSLVAIAACGGGGQNDAIISYPTPANVTSGTVTSGGDIDYHGGDRRACPRDGVGQRQRNRAGVAKRDSASLGSGSSVGRAFVLEHGRRNLEAGGEFG